MRKLFSPNCSECIRYGFCVSDCSLKIGLESALIAYARVISRSLESLNAGDKVVSILFKRRTVALKVTDVNVTEKRTRLSYPIKGLALDM